MGRHRFPRDSDAEDALIRIARKAKHPDEGDRPAIAPTTPVEAEITKLFGA